MRGVQKGLPQVRAATMYDGDGAAWLAPDTDNDHGDLRRQRGKAQTGPHIVQALKREVLLLTRGPEHVRDELNERLDRRPRLPQGRCHGRLLQKAIIGLSVGPPPDWRRTPTCPWSAGLVKTSGTG